MADVRKCKCISLCLYVLALYRSFTDTCFWRGRLAFYHTHTQFQKLDIPFAHIFTVRTLKLNGFFHISSTQILLTASHHWVIELYTQLFFSRHSHVMHMLLCWISKYERSLFILREPDTVMQYHIMGSRWKIEIHGKREKVMKQQICNANWVQLVWP